MNHQTINKKTPTIQSMKHEKQIDQQNKQHYVPENVQCPGNEHL